MLEMEFSYNTYQYASFIAPLAALLLSLVGTLVSIYTIVILCLPCRKRMRQLTKREIPHKILVEVEEKGGKIPCWTFIFGGLKMIYGHQVDEMDAKGKPTVYSICGRHVKSWLLVVLFMVVVFVCSCVAVAFWSEFLVEESYHCQSDVDCFALDEHNTALQQEPLSKENCTEVEAGGTAASNVTLHCFKFVFNYASALGNAGGVLVLASAVMNIQTGLWIGAGSCQGRCGWSLAVAAVSIVNIIIEIAMFALPFVVYYVPLLRENITKSTRNQVQFFTYWIAFLCAFTFSGPILTFFSKKPVSSQNGKWDAEWSLGSTGSKDDYRMKRPYSVGEADKDGETAKIKKTANKLYPNYSSTQ